MSSSRGTSATVRLTPSRTTSSAQLRPDPLLGHQPLEVVDAADRHAVDADDQVLRRAGPRAAAGESVDRPRRPRPRGRGRASPATRGGSGRAPPAMPIQARRTRPSRISAETIRRVVALIGTASPSPTPATAVLMPTTRPRPSTSAPPELPGLSAASVWITSSMTRVAPPGAGGQRAAERGDHAGGDGAGEAVRVADRHHELADAQRGWRRPARPARGRADSARSTARSDSGSAPTIRASSSLPSTNEARTRGAASRRPRARW